jgi:hypothetical protein
MAKIISLEQAIALTQAYQNSVIGIGQTISADVTKTDLDLVLNQPNCVGLRIYNALEDDNTINFVLMGIDENGNDITNGIILNFLNTNPKNSTGNKSQLEL